MKTSSRLILIALAACAAPASAAEGNGRTAVRPSFVVIMAEAQGWASASVQMDDAVPGSRSSLALTPHLEQLAAGGMRFSNFYAASPRCTPTRAALFTGKSPAALHMTFVNEGRGGESGFPPAGSKLVPPVAIQELPETETTVAELLKREGYATGHFGKWHVGRVSPGRHGFDENDGPNNNGGPENVENPNPQQAFAITARATDFMERQAKTGQPFYLQVSHYPGRGGTDARPETYADVRRRATTQRDQAVDAAAVAQDMDATIGQLLAKLDALGLAGRTYVIYTSDHGAQGRNANGPLANGKGTVWEGGLRVPLIVRGPGVVTGRCAHERASTVDLFPTIAALAGAKVEAWPKGLEGGSLVPVLAGGPDASVKRARTEFVVHFPHYDRNAQNPASALMLGNDKLILPYDTGVPMLFDLARDLGESHDIAPEKPARVAELERRLRDYLKAVNAQMPARQQSR